MEGQLHGYFGLILCQLYTNELFLQTVLNSLLATLNSTTGWFVLVAGVCGYSILSKFPTDTTQRSTGGCVVGVQLHNMQGLWKATNNNCEMRRTIWGE